MPGRRRVRRQRDRRALAAPAPRGACARRRTRRARCPRGRGGCRRAIAPPRRDPRVGRRRRGRRSRGTRGGGRGGGEPVLGPGEVSPETAEGGGDAGAVGGDVGGGAAGRVRGGGGCRRRGRCRHRPGSRTGARTRARGGFHPVRRPSDRRRERWGGSSTRANRETARLPVRRPAARGAVSNPAKWTWTGKTSAG